MATKKVTTTTNKAATTAKKSTATKSAATKKAVAKKAPAKGKKVTYEMVQQRAFEIYQESGYQEGHHLEHWIQAEKELGMWS